MSEGATIIISHSCSFTWMRAVSYFFLPLSLARWFRSIFPSRNKPSFVVKHLPPHSVNALVGIYLRKINILDKHVVIPRVTPIAIVNFTLYHPCKSSTDLKSSLVKSSWCSHWLLIMFAQRCHLVNRQCDLTIAQSRKPTRNVEKCSWKQRKLYRRAELKSFERYRFI